MALHSAYTFFAVHATAVLEFYWVDGTLTKSLKNGIYSASNKIANLGDLGCQRYANKMENYRLAQEHFTPEVIMYTFGSPCVFRA